MPKITLEINEIEKNINRPVVLQIVEDIRKLSDFPSTANVYFKAEASQTVNRESVMDSTDKKGVSFSHEDRILVEREMKYSDYRIYTSQPYRINFNPIFLDKEFNINLSPLIYEVEVETTITFISKDKPTLEKWRSNLRRKIGESAKAYEHRVDYTYPIDFKLLKILHHLYETKGKYIPNEESFIEWIARNSYEKITGITNQIGNGHLTVVEQGQIGVVGKWNLAETPKLTKVDTGDVYQSEINYTFKFFQPTSLTLEYPIILNNEIVEPMYRLPCDFNVPLAFGTPEKLKWGLDITRSDAPKHYPCEPLILPCFDEWRPKRIPMGTATLYQALIKVDPDDPTYIMDLTDLGEEYTLAPWVLELMHVFNDDVFLLGASPIIISFYRNQNWSEYELLRVTKSFKLYTNESMELFNEYHVRFGLYTDLTLLTEQAIKKIKEYGLLTNKLLETLGPEYSDALPEVLSDGSLRNREMWDHIRLLKETNHNYKTNKEVRRFTVGSCIVTTRRTEDAIS